MQTLRVLLGTIRRHRGVIDINPDVGAAMDNATLILSAYDRRKMKRKTVKPLMIGGMVWCNHCGCVHFRDQHRKPNKPGHEPR